VSGRGYDVQRIAADAAAFALADDKPVVASTPQPDVAAKFRRAGLVVFDEEASALAALGQFVGHHELMDRARSYPPRPSRRPSEAAAAAGRPLSEWQALQLLRGADIATVEAVLCTSADQAAAAFGRLGGGPVAVKGCPAEATHKSELGLVRLNVGTADGAAAAARELLDVMAGLRLAADGVLVAPMVSSRIEALVGAHVDPVFGPVVLVGAGGRYVEVTGDVQVLLPPFDAGHALRAIGRLGIAPLLAGVRGEPPADVDAWAATAVRLGSLMLANNRITSVDINPLLLGDRGKPGAVAVDAVVVLRD
jgi:acyl-CoA synthetase (NDP forming)